MTGASTIFAGGSIHTMSPQIASPDTDNPGPVGQPEAVRCDSGRITAIGPLAELRRIGSASEVDLAGRCLMPGFVDAHTHPLMLGQSSSWADLSTAMSVDEVVKLLREHDRANTSTSTIRGFGYDQHRLAEDRHPTASDLDRVSDDREVTIMHTSGHGYVVNSFGLANAGITHATPTPVGGLIDRDPSGNPTGRIFDAACDLLTGLDGVKITNHGPNFHLPDEPGVLSDMLDGAQQLFLAAGITAVGDCQVTEREMSTFLRARDAGRLRLRVTMYVLSSHLAAVTQLGLTSRLGDDWLAFGGIKHYADGSLISGTAYVPCGCGVTHGYLYHPEDELEALITAASDAGLQTATHAQGPEAIQLVLNALAAAEPRPDLRHRIEHCGFPTDDQIETMKRLGVVPVPQPTQVHRFGDGVRNDHPELADRMYPSGLFAAAGLPVVLSSDAPVTAPDVMLACWCAETRRTTSGRVLGESGCIARYAALSGYTSGGAFALRREDVGVLEVDRHADFAVLESDPLTSTVDELPDIEVDETWVAGEMVWSRQLGMVGAES